MVNATIAGLHGKHLSTLHGIKPFSANDKKALLESFDRWTNPAANNTPVGRKEKEREEKRMWSNENMMRERRRRRSGRSVQFSSVHAS
jgi:hypothetical protein